MSAESHVEVLRKKHQDLSDQIESAQRAPGSDDLQIGELKRKKLRLKEEIVKFEPVH